jgi:transposase
MLFVGIDWSDKALDFELRAAEGEALMEGQVKPGPEGMIELFSKLDQHAPPGAIAIGIETTRAAWIQSLLDRGYTVYPLTPVAVDHFRKALSVAGNKSDKIDRRVIAMYLATFHRELRALRPDAPEIVALRLMSQDRVKLVEEHTAKSNELTAILKVYYPFFLEFFGTIDSRIALDFLKEFPTQNQMRGLSERKLRGWLKRHRYTHSQRTDEMVAHLHAPVLAVPEHEQSAKATRIVFLARSLATLQEEIELVDKDLTRRLDALPEAQWVRSIPGAGTVLAPAILAVVGRDPQRFDSRDEAAGLVGTAPVTIKSGSSERIRFRRSCWKFARRTFQLLAEQARKKEGTWSAALYDRLRAEGRRHHPALRAVAHKWLRIILALKRTGTCYDERIFTHSQALRKSQAKALPT